MRGAFVRLITVLSIAVLAKITMPLWSHHAPSPAASAVVASPSVPITAPPVALRSSSGRPDRQHDATAPDAPDKAYRRVPSSPRARASGGLDDAFNALVEIADISIAQAEALPSGKDADVLASLRSLQQRLQEREKELDEREKKLREMETKALVRIDELKQMESALRDLLKQEDSIKSKKIKRLTAVYSGMKPDRAAPVIARMDLETVVKIFLRMDEKRVGKILSFLPPQKAVVISEALTQRIISLKR